MQKSRHIFVNGYGATRDLKDGNYRSYLGAVSQAVRGMDGACTIHLCGGFTSHLDLSEARCMLNIWEHLGGLPWRATAVLQENTDTARDNVRVFRERVGDVPAVLFCEASRYWTMRFFASAYFTTATVVGVPFDKKSMRLRHRVKQICFNLPLEIAAFHLPWVDKIRQKLRKAHVARVRKEVSQKES